MLSVQVVELFAVTRNNKHLSSRLQFHYNVRRNCVDPKVTQGSVSIYMGSFMERRLHKNDINYICLCYINIVYVHINIVYVHFCANGVVAIVLRRV